MAMTVEYRFVAKKKITLSFCVNVVAVYQAVAIAESVQIYAPHIQIIFSLSHVFLKILDFLIYSKQVVKKLNYPGTILQ